MKKIMLDAGHYANYNQSTVIPEYWESRRMWLLCEYLFKELTDYGFTVFKTRTDVETDLPVYERGKTARDCDLFISLHSNACDTEKVNRVDVYGAYDNLNNSHELALLLATAIADLMKVSGGYVKTRKSDNAEDEYYGVLRGARRVGCPLFYIIEHSFHTNEYATRWLLDDANLLKLAKLEAAVIATYFGIKPSFVKGDVNMNGELDSEDILLIKRAYFGTFLLNDEQKELADMDNNGEVDSFDYILAKRKYFNC